MTIEEQIEIVNQIEQDYRTASLQVLEDIKSKEYIDITDFNQSVSFQTASLDIYRKEKLEPHDFLEGNFLTIPYAKTLLHYLEEVKKIRSSKFPLEPSIF